MSDSTHPPTSGVAGGAAGAAAAASEIIDLTTSPDKASALDAPARRVRPRMATSADSEVVAHTVTRLRVVSYNIDGLEPAYVEERAKGVCGVLEALSPAPDIIMLQEVTRENDPILRTYASAHGYSVYTGADVCPVYYCMALVRNSTLTAQRLEITPFPTSAMGRHLIEVSANVGASAERVMFWTSHMESMNEQAPERKRQLEGTWKRMRRHQTHAALTVLVGDLNLRDQDVGELGGVPVDMEDAWETAGKPADARYTWDLKLNDNKRFSNGATPRCRYDRMYWGPSTDSKWRPAQFFLIGRERMGAPVKMFPSDHFGVVVDFDHAVA